jgi:O-antigen/teichoic acid export membrane protein
MQLNFFYKLKIDKPIAYLLIGRICGMALGLLATIFIAKFFSINLQGYFYTFNSLISLKIFLELGLSVVLISCVSHEWSKLSLNNDGELKGPSEAIDKITKIGGFARNWFLRAGLLTFIILFIGGFFFFNAKEISNDVNWFWPWLTLSALTGLCVMLTPVWSILEGCNQTVQVYKTRLYQSVFSGALLCFAVYLGLGLWSTILPPLVEIMACMHLIFIKYRKLIKSTLNTKSVQNQIENWKNEILPMQWRLSLSWVAGYLTFSTFIPILFYFHGPELAGQMGMTWMFIGALTAVSSSWVTPKLPNFGVHIARKNWRALDLEFWATVKVVSIISGLLGFGMFLGLCFINWLSLDYAKRLLDPISAGLFLLATIGLCISLPFSTYLRAHKQEPLLKISLCGGVATVVLVWFLSKEYLALGAASGYLAVTLIQLPLIYILWKKKKIEWQR